MSLCNFWIYIISEIYVQILWHLIWFRTILKMKLKFITSRLILWILNPSVVRTGYEGKSLHAVIVTPLVNACGIGSALSVAERSSCSSEYFHFGWNHTARGGGGVLLLQADVAHTESSPVATHLYLPSRHWVFPAQSCCMQIPRGFLGFQPVMQGGGC